MRKYYLTGVISICFAILVSCQTVTNQKFFSLGHSDATITAAVNAAFASHPDLAAVPIHVDTHKGTVILSGYVKTIRQSDTAGDVAGKVAGVRAVQNGLIVRK